MKFQLQSPQSRLYAILIPTFIFLSVTVFLALAQKETNVKLEVGTELSSNSESFLLKEIDFIPEPQAITDDSELSEFFLRQEKINSILSENNNYGARNFSDLSYDFWIQLLVGFGAVLITATVWAFNPHQVSTIFFLLSGIATLLFTTSAAIYTTRSAPIDIEILKLLMRTNSFGASLYGITTIALFMVYPKRVPKFKNLFILQVLFFGSWTLLSLLELIPVAFNVNLVTFMEMLVIIAMISFQFFLTKNNPEARASLTWIGTAFIIGAGSFIFLNAAPIVLGQKDPWLDQSTAFTFFLLIYLGIAAGLLKYKLFEVKKWSFHIMFNALAMLSIFALDILLVSTFNIKDLSALSLSIIAISFIYIPTKTYLLNKLQKTKKHEPYQIFESVIKVSLSISPELRFERWKSFLQSFFSPLELEMIQGQEELRIDNNGNFLFVPAIFNNYSLKLSYPQKGKALFSMIDLKTISQVIHLLKTTEENRDAYERGVQTERKRLAQDLHDDIGSQLLTGVHQADENSKEIFREALERMKSMISNLSQDKIALSEILSILRFETVNRLSLLDILVEWETSEKVDHEIKLHYLQHKTLTSSIREIVSNVMKYSQAKKFKVAFDVNSNYFNIKLEDDGIGFPEESTSLGNGINNIKKRMEKIEGDCSILTTSTNGTSIHLSFKLDQA